VTETPRDSAQRALADPTTPAAELMQIVSAHPDLGWAAAEHPNAYPALVDWVRQYSPRPGAAEAPGPAAGADHSSVSEPAPTPGTAAAPAAEPAAGAAHPPATETHPAAPAPTAGAAQPPAGSKPRSRGLLIGAIIAVAVVVLGGGAVAWSTWWSNTHNDTVATQPDDEAADDGAAGDDAGGDADGEGADGQGADGADGEASDPEEPAEPTPDERTDELEAAAKRNGFPVELQGDWCPDEVSEETPCFSIEDWASENPDGFVAAMEDSPEVYFERPGATSIQLCYTDEEGMGGSCSTAATMILLYYPAGVPTNACDDEYVTSGFEGCEPVYEYDDSRDRLIIVPNHQQSAVFYVGAPMYRQ